MITEILIFIITTLIGYYLYVYKKIHNHFKERDVKFLPGVPFFGNAFNSIVLRKHLIDDLYAVYKAFPGERYVGYIEGITPVILMRDPELMKTITIKDFDHFPDHKEFFSEEMEPLFGESLIMMKGNKWREMRTTLSPAFTGSKLRQMMPFMQVISKNIVDYLKDQNGKDVDVDDVMHRFTTDIAASTAFGLEVNSLKDRDNEFLTMGQGLFKFSTLQRVYQFFCSQFPGLTKKLRFTVSHTKVTKFYMNLVSSTMEFRKKNNVTRPDMIQLLMEASKEWTLVQLASQALTFFVGSFETSASTMTMCLHELAIHPDIQEKLYQEVKEFMENHKLSFENVKELKYMDCVLNETFRKWSVAIVMDRVCNKTYDLPPAHDGGKPYRLNPGDIVYNVVNAIQMDPEYFPDPEVFNPDRFFEDNKQNIKPFTFNPFGLGPRACIGMRFALLELKILLLELISNFKILKCEKTAEPIKLQAVDFNIKAQGGTWIKFEPRN
ncbi:probable cytochrome P450 9f2 isoform X2 [Ostrinia furnacalis]|uniref:probable cytochrome P450 9f2 isoform X2 n=1 Tax=Ostrinia furnacalis TaxID=93504 RepID=UPI00103BA63F|nr:probable cytochrome P450 9f2 isoform X2 [Ostrinia furnacalis]